ncbi:MAG: ribonuclease III [Desulfovibrionales bacterium]|nr:ribonuclease III [Desulfovibrionales bacterium]
MSQEIPMDALQALQSEIHYEFKQVKLFIQAITHTSYANEQGGVHNERLEFLGDAVLELAVSHALFLHYPEAQEGHLTKMRSSLVSEAALAAAARRIGLGPILLLGRGEESQGGREKNSVLSDALEALLGAVYLDGGIKAVFTCVDTLFQGQWPTPPSTFRPRDFKSQLQELTQMIWKARPTYALRDSQGPEHAKQYTVALTLPDGTQVEWMESSMRKAEQGAAARALKDLKTRFPSLLPDAQEV